MKQLFTKEGCEKCQHIKDFIKEKDIQDVEVLSLETIEGLGILVYHEGIALAHKVLPILVDEDGKLVTGTIRIKKSLEEEK